MLNRTQASIVQLSVKEGIAAQDLHSALDRILGVGGCPACGLVGIDVRFRGEGDPLIHASLRDKLKDLPDVLDVNVLHGTGGLTNG